MGVDITIRLDVDEELKGSIEYYGLSTTVFHDRNNQNIIDILTDTMTEQVREINKDTIKELIICYYEDLTGFLRSTAHLKDEDKDSSFLLEEHYEVKKSTEKIEELGQILKMLDTGVKYIVEVG